MMEGRCRAVLLVLRVASSEAQVSGRHVLFSESARKSLVAMKAARRAVGARRLQTWWRRLVAKNNLQSAASSLGLSLVSWRICRIPMCNVFAEYSIQRRSHEAPLLRALHPLCRLEGNTWFAETRESQEPSLVVSHTRPSFCHSSYSVPEYMQSQPAGRAPAGFHQLPTLE